MDLGDGERGEHRGIGAPNPRLRTGGRGETQDVDWSAERATGDEGPTAGPG